MNASISTAPRMLALAIALLVSSGLSPGNMARATDYGREPRSVKVLVRDLDLRTPQGVAALYLRLRNAARSVCGYTDSRLLEEKVARNTCVDAAIGNAVDQVGSANLTNYYLAKNHRAHALTTAQAFKPVDNVR